MKTRKLINAFTIVAILLFGGYQQGSYPTKNIVVTAQNTSFIYLPIITNRYVSPASNWPQLGHDAQRTNSSTQQVDPPYCYAWKWDAVPIASRAQPIVVSGILFVGGMDGRLYARDATSGAPLWNFQTGGPIRHSPGASRSFIITGSYDGYTYALNINTGSLAWKTFTGSSATAPLIDEGNQRVYVGSTYGTLSALNLSNGNILWQYDSGAAILTSPSLSVDGKLVYFGNEAVKAIAINSVTGNLVWQTTLQGESLMDRYPVVMDNAVFYRSQPYYFMYEMLQNFGDNVMDQAGSINSDWNADWVNVKSKIVSFLSANPSVQTFFALDPNSGSYKGIAPVLYTFGDNDPPNVPVINNNRVFLTYRARHGIQTDNHANHVSSKYDAELGVMDANTLDISGLHNSTPYSIPLWGGPPFRMTSDEPAVLTMSGDILLVDNWERAGGVNVKTNALVHVSNVSNDWPVCNTQCGSAGPNPFFPLSGSTNEKPYPFPSPVVTEGNSRAGVVVGNNMLYWRVLGAGLGGMYHQTASSCPSPNVWTDKGGSLYDISAIPDPPQTPMAIQDYVLTDMTTPIIPVPANTTDLVNRLNKEVKDFLLAANGNHLMPYYIERGRTTLQVWPYNAKSGQSGIPEINRQSHGNGFWHDPGELLYSMAMAYPYLDTTLKAQLKTYITQELGRYPLLQDLPYDNLPWLRTGSPREQYNMAPSFRSSLNNWPPVGASSTSLYSLWLWSKNTGDWSYAQTLWNNGTITILQFCFMQILQGL
jgi:outer membrane protein assembly factor BamB